MRKVRGGRVRVLAVLALGTAAAMGLAHPAWSCDTGSVRDAAVKAKRDVHHLCVIANRDDAAAEPVFKQLDTWLRADTDKLNVSLERVNADDPAIEWRDYGIPSVPPKLPVVALIGEFPSPRRAVVIDHWEPAPNENDLAILHSSPTREAIKQALATRWAVIVHAPGAQPRPNVQSLLDAVDKKWGQDQPPGVAVIRFDRADARERVLCAFAGIESDGPDWVGIIFGRGKLMAPPLQGEEITENNLNQLLQRLAEPCTCLQQSITLGIDIPMTWEPALDAKLEAIAPPQGYVETTLDAPKATPDPPKPSEPAAALMQDIAPKDKQVLATAAAPLAGAGGVAVIAIAFVVWRNRRRPADRFVGPK